MLKDLKKIWLKKNPSKKEIEFFFENNPANLLSKKSDYSYLKNYALNFIHDFNKFAFSKRFGFPGFDLADIYTYLFTNDLFEFSLKKEKGKNLLYGVDHINLRQKFFNNLPQKMRKSLGLNKLQHFDLPPNLANFLGAKEKDFSLQDQLADIFDLGMAHSIYLVKLKVGNKFERVVIKKKEVNYQKFYTKILTLLGWPSYKTEHYLNDFGSWELTEFLGFNSLHTVIKDKSLVVNKDKLIVRLAEQAALGDALGHGDRHLENYIYKKGRLLPIDIAYLFWPDNEKWIKTYILGGVYEFNFLGEYSESANVLQEKIVLFFTAYAKTFSFLNKKKELILKAIEDFFVSDAPKEILRKKNFFLARVENRSSYINAQKELYLNSFFSGLARLPYKRILAELVEKEPEIVFKHNYLKMYYLANKNRSANFYLCEKQKTNVFLLIKRLAENNFTSIS